jgi:hypothetical protein
MIMQVPQKSTKHPFYNIFRSLTIFIGLALVFNSCESCGCKTPHKDLDTNGKLEISVDKTTLQDKPNSQERIFKLLTKLPDNTPPNVIAQIKNFSLRVEVKATGGTAGANTIKYTSHEESGNSTAATLTDGSTKTEPIQHFFKTTKEGYIEFKEILEETFEIVPGNDTVTKIQVTFQLLDQNGSDLGDAHTVTWQSGPRLILTVDASTLDGEFVNFRNKNGTFAVNITKQGNGGVEEDLQTADLNNLYILATPSNGNALLNGGNCQKLDGSPAASIKIIQMNPGAPNKKYVRFLLRAIKKNGETTLSLALAEHKDSQYIPITIQKAVKVPSLPKVKLEIGGSHTLNLRGSNKKLNIEITPEDNLTINDLKNIKLKYTPYPDPSTSIPELKADRIKRSAQGVTLYKLLGRADRLKILSNQSTTISFTINPQTATNPPATSVSFNGLRLSNTATENDPAYYIESINWCVAPVKLSLWEDNPNKKDFYGANEEDITFTITAEEEVSAAELAAIKFSYTSSPTKGTTGTPASLQYDTTNGGGNWQDANNVDLASLLRLIGVNLPKGKRVLTLKVVHADDNNPVETKFEDIKLNNSNEKISGIKWHNPDVDLQLNGLHNFGSPNFMGYDQNQLTVSFTITKTGGLNNKDLGRLRLKYNPFKTKSKLSYKANNLQDANDESLFELLAGATPDNLLLYINPDDRDEISANFSDIQIINSHSSKTVSIQWTKPNVQIQLEKTKDTMIYGFDEKQGNTYIKKVPIVITVGAPPLSDGDLDSLHLEFGYNDANTTVKLLAGTTELPLNKNGNKYQISLKEIGIPNNGSETQFHLAFAIEKNKNNPNSFDPFTIENIKINGASENNNPARSIPKIAWNQPIIQLSLKEANEERIGYSDKRVAGNDGNLQDIGRAVSFTVTNPMQLAPINYDIIELHYVNNDMAKLKIGGKDINGKTLLEIINALPALTEFNENGFTIPALIDNNDLNHTKFKNIHLTNCSGANTIKSLHWRTPTVKLEIIGNGNATISNYLTIGITSDHNLTKADLDTIMFEYELTANQPVSYYIESTTERNEINNLIIGNTSISLGELLKQIGVVKNTPLKVYLKPIITSLKASYNTNTIKIEMKNIRLSNADTLNIWSLFDAPEDPEEKLTWQGS